MKYWILRLWRYKASLTKWSRSKSVHQKTNRFAATESIWHLSHFPSSNPFTCCNIQKIMSLTKELFIHSPRIHFTFQLFKLTTTLFFQVFHVCALTDDGLIMKSFLCPESTLFDQTILKCNWWFYVDCKNSKKLYDSNIPISKSYQLMKALTFFSSYKKDASTPKPADKDWWSKLEFS